MSALLLPAYSVLFGMKATSLYEDINLCMYILLVCIIFAFPFVYITIGFIKKSNKQK